MSEKEEYLVVLQYTKEAGGYEHVRFFTAYKSREALHAWLPTQKELEVVEEGITLERAVALVKETPDSAYFHAAISDATSARTGEIVPELLLHSLSKAAFAAEWKRS